MTIVALGVFCVIGLGLALVFAGAVARSRAVVVLGVLVLAVGLALFFGIRASCSGMRC